MTNDREFVEPDLEHPGPRVGEPDLDEDTFTEPLPPSSGGPLPPPPTGLEDPDQSFGDHFDAMPGEEYQTRSEPWRHTARERLFRETSSAITVAHGKVLELAKRRGDASNFIAAMAMLESAHSYLERQLNRELPLTDALDDEQEDAG